MPDLRAVLDRKIERIDVRPFTLGSFHTRRERKRRHQRLAAGAVGLSVAIAAGMFVVRAFEDRTIRRDSGAPPEGLVRFASPFYGYSIDHPEEWRVKPALLPWTSGVLTGGLLDRLVDPTGPNRIVLEVASIEVPARMTPDAWMDREEKRQAYELGLGTKCDREHAIAPTKVDGVPGRLSVDCGLVVVVSEGRGYVIRLHGDVAIRLDLRAVLRSIQLHPEEV
jgi:hypothetical protein